LARAATLRGGERAEGERLARDRALAAIAGRGRGAAQRLARRGASAAGCVCAAAAMSLGGTAPLCGCVGGRTTSALACCTNAGSTMIWSRNAAVSAGSAAGDEAAVLTTGVAVAGIVSSGGARPQPASASAISEENRSRVITSTGSRTMRASCRAGG